MEALKKSRKNIILKLFNEKRYKECEEAAVRFIKNYPEDAFGWKLAGAAASLLKNYQEAEKRLLKAITIDKKDSETITILGNVLRNQGRIKESLDCYERALEIDPENPAALNGKALNLMDLDKGEKLFNEAFECLSKAVLIRPNHSEFYYNLGVYYGYKGDYSEAIKAHQKAIELDPNSANAYNNLALILQEILQLDEALLQFDKAIQIQPDVAFLYSNRLFAINYHPTKSAEEIFAFYQEFDKRFGAPYRSRWRVHTNDSDPEKRLRIGYVSSDFRAHSTTYFLEPLLAHHDHTQFEIFAYAQNASLDHKSLQYRELVDHWVPVASLDDEATAERIRADQIDILVELAGHTAGNRLLVFARRPAPVSVTWLGYGYTTGLSAIDYFLGDTVLTPPGCDHLFSERLWRLDRPWVVYRPNPNMGEPGPLPALHHGFVTFGTLTRGIRLNHRVIRVWSEILKRTPGSRLLMNSKSFAEPAMQNYWATHFGQYGIERERLILGYQSPPWDVLRGLDITLDCFPHNSSTTLLESLYMGIPYITLADRPSVGRLGSTILVGLGHPEWIAYSEEEYIEKAVELASDLQRLAAIRANLRSELEASPLRDEEGFARAMERAYRAMWRKWCESVGA